MLPISKFTLHIKSLIGWKAWENENQGRERAFLKVNCESEPGVWGTLIYAYCPVMYHKSGA